MIHQLCTKFALKELDEVSYFLGIEVFKAASGSLLLTQPKYAHDLLSRTKMLQDKTFPTPMITVSNCFQNMGMYSKIHHCIAEQLLFFNT